MFSDKKTKSVADAVAKIMSEELKGMQHKIDVAEPKGKLTGADFKKLRSMKKEEAEQINELSSNTLKNYQAKNMEAGQIAMIRGDKKTLAKRTAGKHAVEKKLAGLQGEEVENLDEVKLADLPKRTVKGKSYGADYEDPEGRDDADEKPAEPVKRGRGRPKGTFKRRFNTKLYKESFTEMMQNLDQRGLDFVSEMLVVEEPTNDEYTAEVKDAQEKSEGKGKKAEVAKPAVQAVKNEEVEQILEGKMDKMSLSHLWNSHAEHSYMADQGYGHGGANPNLNHHAATAIENHVRKHYGNKVADDMVSHSDHHVIAGEYAGPDDADYHEKEMEKLKKKHNIKEEVEQIDEEILNEVSLQTKIKAYAQHSNAAYEAGDYGNEDDEEKHTKKADKLYAHILKHHGPEAAAHAEKAANSATFGTEKSRNRGNDKLSGGLRKHLSTQVTKSGKIPKSTQKAMKNVSSRITGPKGKLPEEVEQIFEGRIIGRRASNYHKETDYSMPRHLSMYNYSLKDLHHGHAFHSYVRDAEEPKYGGGPHGAAADTVHRIEKHVHDEYGPEAAKQLHHSGGARGGPDGDDENYEKTKKLAQAHYKKLKDEEKVFTKAPIQKTKNEEVEQIDERHLTSAETKKKEEVVKSMKKKLSGFRERYGKRAKEVMYATATKVAKGSK